MATIVGIPAPTDSYDHENCNKSNLTSVRSLIAAFDASMDSLHDSINSQISKLDDISRRAKHCEQDWNTMKDDSNTCTSTHANDSTSNSDGDKIQNDDDSGLESTAKGLSVFFSFCAFVTKVTLILLLLIV